MPVDDASRGSDSRSTTDEAVIAKREIVSRRELLSLATAIIVDAWTVGAESRWSA